MTLSEYTLPLHFIVNFKHISHYFDVYLVNFEQAITGWEMTKQTA